MAKQIATHPERRLLLGGTALIVLLTVLLYWPTLQLPLLYDDLLHIRITKSLNFANVWLPTEAFGFYRPFTFLPFLIIQAIFGYYPSWLLHGFNVAQHACNVVLLIALAWRLWDNTPRALAAGLFFAIFPFSYQAIAVYGHNVHPTIVNLLLLGLHTYLSAISAASQTAFRWWAFTWFIFIISLLTHESAVLFGFFAALLQWNGNGRFPLFPDLLNPRRSPWLWFAVVGICYLVIYQFLPISRAPNVAGEDGLLFTKLLYLAQDAAYPLAWLGKWLPRTSGRLLVIICFVLTLLLTLWAARRRDQRLPLLLGWGWWALASAVIALPLPTDYLLHGPRLLYLGSVGLACFVRDWRIAI